MRELHSAGWLAQWPLGYFVLDREAVEFFLRSKKVTFPGLKMAEIFGVTEGPLFEEISRNILSLNGEDHRRLRARRGALQAVRVADDRGDDGSRALVGPTAPRLVELDPAAVRHRGPDGAAGPDRAGGGGVLRVRPRPA